MSFESRTIICHHFACCYPYSVVFCTAFLLIEPNIVHVVTIFDTASVMYQFVIVLFIMHIKLNFVSLFQRMSYLSVLWQDKMPTGRPQHSNDALMLQHKYVFVFVHGINGS